MKIIVDKDIPYIQGRFPEDVEVSFLAGNEISAEKAKEADALIVRTRTRCNKDLLNNTKVRLVATATIGTDHIDCEWCDTNGVVVRNAPGCNAPGVAQYVFSSLFKTGFNIEKDVLGIIGYGHVGSLVGEWARLMGIKILISDAPRKESGFKDVDYLSREEVLKKSDAVTLHVPFTKIGEYPTSNMIGEKELGIMKPGTTIINSSRGGVVDETALKKVIKSGKIKAILDTWVNEPYIDPELARMVEISTPHIAGYSEQGKKRATRMSLEAVNEVLDIPVDLNGLECQPKAGLEISRSLIEKSYNPLIDSTALRADLSKFEQLRNTYSYRPEPLFT